MKPKRLALRFISLLLLILLPPVFAAEPAVSERNSGSPASNPEKPWLVTGSVVTTTGQPLADVDMIAHTGIGSLKVGGRTTTKSDGTFQLPFGPGFWSKDREGVQAATISARKDGWFETNLYRQGHLVAALKLPEGEIGWGKNTTNDVFLPGQPKILKFTMAPAAHISGMLLDQSGAPIKNTRVGLTGDALRPSTSVFAEVKTNDRGEFTFKNLPTTFPLKLYAESPNENWRKWPALTLKLNDPKSFILRLKLTGHTLSLSSEPPLQLLNETTRERE